MKKPGITGFMWDNRSRAGRCTTTSRPLTHESLLRLEGSVKPTKVCSIPGCNNSGRITRTWCSTHYSRWLRGGGTDVTSRIVGDDAARFWEKVAKTPTCWNWTASKSDGGYGRFKIGGNLIPAHRVSYEWAKGSIPEGMHVDHKCHNPGCVNPDHLRPVTNKQNAENLAGPRRDSKTGIRGVAWDKRHGKWLGRVGHNNFDHHVGYFDDLAEAEAAVIAKRLELYTHNDIDRIAA